MWLLQMRLRVQAEQETLRVHERLSQGSVLSACCLLDTDAVTAAHWLTSDHTPTTTTSTSTSSSTSSSTSTSRHIEQMMRDIGDKFSKLRVRLKPCSQHIVHMNWTELQFWTRVGYSESNGSHKLQFLRCKHSHWIVFHRKYGIYCCDMGIITSCVQ